MSSDLSTIQSIATAIRRREFTEPLATALQTLLSQPEDAERLIQKIVQEEDAASENHYAALQNTQNHLVALDSFHKAHACALMTHLWGIAANVIGCHAVPDAIGLFVQGLLEDGKEPSDLVLKQIHYQIRPENDPDVREHFQYFYDRWKTE